MIYVLAIDSYPSYLWPIVICYWYSHLDMRVVLSHSDVKEAEEDVCREWGKKVFESVTFDVE